MKLPSRRYLVLVLSLLAVGQAPAQTPGGLDRLAWLAGCWARDVSARAEAGSGEQWMAPVGGSMLGVSRTIRGGKTVEHEFMQLRVGADGVLAFTAKPSGQAEASFPLLRQGERELVFENLQHDFPQRVIYRLEGEGKGERLLARIEGLRGTVQRGIDFPMQRVACDAAADTTAKASKMTTISRYEQQAQGEFEVKLSPQALEGGAGAPGRMLLDKRFHGPLEATSLGQMLAMTSAVKGSAGYVAMELVTGTLAGRRGSFALQHSGTMDRGAPSLSVTVVPDSGTEELLGLSGRMNIRIEGGKHFYEFAYTLPPATK